MFKLEGVKAVTANMSKQIAVINGMSLKGLVLASIIVRRSMATSPPLVPVDTRNLEASWFVTTATGQPSGKDATFTGEDASALKAGHTLATSKGKRMAANERKPFLVMGFSAYYAPYVHENMEAHFQREGAGPKFLEMAIKNNKTAIIKVIKETAKIRK